MNSLRLAWQLSFLFAIATLLWWIAEGGEIFTKSKRLIEETDPLFGTKIQKWVEDFTIGLLPSGTSGLEWVAALPLFGLFLVLGIIFWSLERRRSRVS